MQALPPSFPACIPVVTRMPPYSRFRPDSLLDNEIKILEQEERRVNGEKKGVEERIKDNNDKIKLSKQVCFYMALGCCCSEPHVIMAPDMPTCVLLLGVQLPYLVGNIVEILELKDEDDVEDDGANVDLDSHRKGKCTVIKTSTRQTIFLPVVGLVDPEKLEPGDLVGVNKDSYLILDTLPAEYDSRVKAMEVDEKPSEEYSDIGGLDKQIQELVEALVLPLTHKDRFENIGIKAPKGVLLYGPPGTGKTLMARACAAQTNAIFLKLAGPQLVQMFIGDGAKLVRDAFALAKEKSKPVYSLLGLTPRASAPSASLRCVLQTRASCLRCTAVGCGCKWHVLLFYLFTCTFAE
jgi:26S proteasome regulatory subunit T5